MIKKLSEILYVFLISLVTLSVIILSINQVSTLDNKFIFIIILTLFPFGEILFELIKKDFTLSNISFTYRNNIYKYISIAIFGIAAYFYGISPTNNLLWIFALFSILFSLDSRISFLGALILLIFTPIHLLMGEKEIAETLSIYAYYFLIIGVTTEIKSQIFEKKEEKEPKNISDLAITEAKTSLIKMAIIFIGIYIKKFQNKYRELKNNILTDIGEAPSIKHTVEEKISKQKTIPFLQKTENILSLAQEKKENIRQNLYIKLTAYFIKKLKEHITSLTLFLFSINIFGAILSLKYNTFSQFFLYTFVLFLLAYLYSKILGKTYSLKIQSSHTISTPNSLRFVSKNVTVEDAVLQKKLLSQEEINNISLARSSDQLQKNVQKNKYFLNKASIFASLGLVAGYILLQYFQISDIGIGIYIAIFSLFFLSYYLVFSNLDSTLFHTSRTSGKYVKTKISKFSLKGFLKKHIYLVLNFILVCAIVITIGVKADIFSSIQKWNQERNGYQNWTLVKEKIKVLTRSEKKEKAEEIRKKIQTISEEATVNTLSGTLSSSGETLSQSGAIEIKRIGVREYYTFRQSLSVGTKTDEVTKLEEIMKKLNYFESEPDNIFDEETKTSLTNLLQTECDWPESTKGILGNQAMQCLYSLEIPSP